MTPITVPMAVGEHLSMMDAHNLTEVALEGNYEFPIDGDKAARVKIGRRLKRIYDAAMAVGE